MINLIRYKNSTTATITPYKEVAMTEAMTVEKLTAVLGEIVQISLRIYDNKSVMLRNACSHLIDVGFKEGGAEIARWMLLERNGEFRLDGAGLKLVWTSYPNLFDIWIAEDTEDGFYPDTVAAIRAYLIGEGLARQAK